MGERSLWIAKDSDAYGVQTVTADLDDLRAWLPEVPAPRRQPATLQRRLLEPEIPVSGALLPSSGCYLDYPISLPLYWEKVLPSPRMGKKALKCEKGPLCFSTPREQQIKNKNWKKGGGCATAT